MVKIVHDELTELMGGETAEIELKNRPAVILMSGLQGSGKTTFSGKLARMLKAKKNRKPLLVACDVYRPAAIEQLKVLGQQIDVPVYSELDSKDPVKIALNAIQEAKAKGYDLVIVDTAGRLAVDEQMMNEIEAIKRAINPDETLFVVDSMTGQDAVNTAREFNERLDFNGVVLTKLDGDTRGGAALSIRTVVKNQSSLWVRVKNWMLLTSSIRHVWPTVSWVWVISFHWLSVHRNSTMKKKQSVFRRRFRRISSTLMTS